MIRCTFQLAPGIGPYRERQIWGAGIRSWEELLARADARGCADTVGLAHGGGTPLAGKRRAAGALRARRRAVVLSPELDARLRAAIDEAGRALAAGDAARLAAMLPQRERWRLYPAFEAEAGFVDVEADADELTVIGILDREGPRTLVRGRDLAEFPELARRWKLLVTYNGAAFDVPALERAFPGWRAPRAHVDLRRLWLRLGHEGGLKLLESRAGLERPPHVARLCGGDAGRLWREGEAGDADALRLLVEYNLYDTVNLKALMVLGYNRMVERLELPAPLLAPWERGDVLYDLTKQLLAR